MLILHRFNYTITLTYHMTEEYVGVKFATKFVKKEKPINKNNENLIAYSKKLYSYSKHFTFNKKNYKKFIRLEPPVKGFGVNGIKKPFSKGGALGYRAKEINDLLRRMM